MTRVEVAAMDLQFGELAALKETGPYVFERVRNLFGYRDGSCVVRSTLTYSTGTWANSKRVWVKRDVMAGATS